MEAKKHQLLNAVGKGNVEEFKELADNDPGILNTSSPRENTALHVAAKFGHTSLVQEIFQRQKKLLVLKNLQGDTPMHVAARAGHTDVITCLINCAKMNVETTSQNLTDIESGREKEKVQEVLRMTDNEGNTSLHGAVLSRRLGAVEIFVREDPELISLTNKAGESPLSIAIVVKSSDILRTIIRPNMSPSLLYMGCGDQTLLHGTIISHDLDSMEIVLQAYPQLISKKDNKMRSPLHHAAAFGYLEMVERLLEIDASQPSLTYQGDKTGETPVHMAAMYGHVTVFTKLLDECPDSIELLDTNGRNVLHLAAQNGKIDTVKYILKLPEMEDLVNAPDKDGYAPLHLSARNLHGEVVRVLLEDPRVDIKAINHDGRSVLERAERLVDLQDSMPEDIADSADVNRMEPRKHFTLKVLKDARAGRAQSPEDILESHPKKTTQNNRNREMAVDKKDSEMAKTVMTITAIVATFTFTAVFNVPGGFKNDGQDEGMATLSKKAAFQAFVILDTIAMSFSLTAMITAFHSLWPGNNDRRLIQDAIKWTLIALLSMGLAFTMGLFAVLSNTLWLAIVVCIIACVFPVVVYFSIGLLVLWDERDSSAPSMQQFLQKLVGNFFRSWL